MLVVGDVADQLGALARVGPQVLGLAARVARDHRVGRRQDRLGRPVVLLEQDRLRVRVVLLEVEDVADRRAPEGVDRLVGVTDDAQLGRWHRLGVFGRTPGRRPVGTRELPHQDVLRVVGVLVLVDEDVTEPAPVVLGHVGEDLQHVDRRHDQVVEVERVGLAQPALVERVGLGQRLLDVRLGPPGEGLVVDQLVLEVADLHREGPRVVALRVEVELPAHQGHQPLRVGRVVDREARRQPDVLGLAPQDPHARRVEGADPHDPGAVADQGGDPLLHLAGGLVGEGDRQDRAGVRVPRREQVGDPVGQHPGLARPRAGDDQQRRALVGHRRALLRVEPLQQDRRVARPPLRGSRIGRASGAGTRRRRGCSSPRQSRWRPRRRSRSRQQPGGPSRRPAAGSPRRSSGPAR